MTEKLRQLIEKLKATKTINNHDDATFNRLSVKLGEGAEVLAEIAEEQAESAKKMERMTKWLVYFTIALLIFTVLLVGIEVRKEIGSGGKAPYCTHETGAAGNQ